MAARDLTGAVDFPYLEDYAAGDAELVEEVLSLFEEQTRIWMRLLDPQDAVGWLDGAHTLKGASAGVGAVRLSAVCAEAEDSAAQTPEIRGAILERLKTELGRALQDIAAYRHAQALKSLR